MQVLVDFSPFNEMMISLHVIQNPSHHPYRKAWAERAQEKLPKELLFTIKEWGPHFYDWMYFINIRNEFRFNEDSVEEAITMLSKVPDLSFAHMLLGEKYSMESLLKWKNSPASAPFHAFEKEVLLKTASWKRKLNDFFYDYNRYMFAEELFRITPWISRAADNFHKELKTSKIAVLNSIHPDITVSAEHIKIKKNEVYTFSFKDFPTLIIQPSTYATPHVMLCCNDDRVAIALHVAVPDSEKDNEPPEDLISLLKVLGEPTRLKILQDVLHHPYSTKQLAFKYGLTEATVSSHLKLLLSCGLAETQRRGYYVFYTGKRERLESLRTEVAQFMQQPVLDEYIYTPDLT
ncbi:winged helix-turn-helix domain-containing protein [Fictibacillus nanhaiensis]|uniref:ArsR/SmtB family transcription factor n=1 Tax=Fictibacillus nanhaiensis TaxID=742169 RepID=UPI001C973FB3|nr:winged helix-turn-helix domain-containing protein [Fictibacillus nanhaiensis]MBY6038402.1 winged helix-turn-helix domain-containing protein [Fictibacillus nanhaiensis]